MMRQTAAEAYAEQLRKLVKTIEQRDEVQARLDAHKAEINSPGPDWDCDKSLFDLRRLERELAHANWLTDIRKDVWYSMPEPKHPPRKRRTVLVDGVRTKLEYA